jgi:hypothetical protein
MAAVRQGHTVLPLSLDSRPTTASAQHPTRAASWAKRKKERERRIKIKEKRGEKRIKNKSKEKERKKEHRDHGTP